MRNKLITFCIFMFLSNTIFSQKYDPIVDKSKVWNVLSGGYGSRMIECCQHTDQIKILDDTIINGLNYSRVISSNNSFKTNRTLGFIREIDKKVYFMNNSLRSILLYDFNLKVKDSILVDYGYYTQYCVVTKIDTVNYNSIKRLRFQFGVNGFDDEWIVGLGSKFGPINTFFTISGGFKELLCVHQNKKQLYMNSNRKSCLINAKN